jgi:GT2 family glycosyltransferase
VIKEFTTVIIVNYKTKEFTRDCVNSVLTHFTPFLYEIIIVDNNSEDGSVEYLQQLFPAIEVIANNKNGGFGYANNIGASRANGQFIFLLNSDTIIRKNILPSFIAFYNYNKNLKPGSIGSLLEAEDGSILHSYGNFPSVLKLPKSSKKNKPNIKKIEENYYAPVDIVVGADMFIEKKVFDEVGGFDENIFLYEEELELQYRLKMAGYSSFVINEKCIIHLEGKSSLSWFKRKCSFISLCYLLKKHLPYYVYLGWRLKRVVYALVFFKNPKTTFTEKLNYLKLSVLTK